MVRSIVGTLIWQLLIGVLLAGCSTDRPGSTEQTRTSDPGNTQGKTTTEAREQKHSVFHLNQESYDLNVVICIGTLTATVTASDSQSRSGYPVVMMRVYDPAATGGYSTNTASAIFERDGYAEHWTLNDGDVEKNGDVFTAFGTLKGNRLETQSDGTRKSVPLTGKDILPFEAHPLCALIHTGDAPVARLRNQSRH